MGERDKEQEWKFFLGCKDHLQPELMVHDKYNYIQLVQKYCPQYLYLPEKAKKPPSEESSFISTDTEQFRQKLMEQEDIWGSDGDKT